MGMDKRMCRKAKCVAETHFGCGITHEKQSATAAMSNARYSHPSGQMRCGWAVGGIFENQFAAQVSVN